jgi:hypothetical protein
MRYAAWCVVQAVAEGTNSCAAIVAGCSKATIMRRHISQW